ncbi:zinc metalloprotease [Knoellia subterranea]|uniref:Peptidase n=1 Tax=Knoellia subterranea KCTC 19937 TaxID=1385521 RepID=A0A0A0JP26_9MICO|nr:zinc metalloprotease [Knoellia subterranea]KGN39170.1 peptidase [Knoellia subterranea KCTC 19937]
MSRRLIRPALGVIALAASSFAASAPATVGASAAPSPAVAECDPTTGATSAARIRDDHKHTSKEPALYNKSEANAYGVLPNRPLMAAGSVTIPTIFHVLSKEPLDAAATTRMNTMIADQVDVLNDSFSGITAPDAADTPFRFDLTKTTWNVNPVWNTVTPGKAERDMKKALHEGDSRTLNVYVADIGGGLLGWAYFPKGVDNNGRNYIDGVVMLDESMPGGTAGKYSLGDTLTHEVGHWLMLDHTFNKGCSAAGDYVADTPREAQPQFDCPEGADTCTAPGLDPIHNFMDYTQDSCMNMFTPGQAKRMSDAWQEFRD